MSFLRTSAVRSTMRISLRRRLCRNYADDAKHAAPAEESFGKGFYIALAAIPLSAAIYKFSAGSDNPLTSAIQKYADFKDRWVQRNDLHTRMIEQAANDRNLFQSSPGSPTIDLKFPEVFDSGSPYNVPAGQGSANLDELIAYYQKKNDEMEEKRLERLAKENGEES